MSVALLLWLLLLVLLVDGASARFSPGRLAPGPSVDEEAPIPNPTSSAARRRCAEMPTRVLRHVLGPAFNEHYMAFSPPPEDEGQSMRPGVAAHFSSFSPFQSASPPSDLPTDTQGGNEGHSSPRVLKDVHREPGDETGSPASSHSDYSSVPFYVEPDFQAVLTDEPAWSVKYEMPETGSTSKFVNYRTSSGRREVLLEGAPEEDSDAHPRVARAPLPLPRNMQWHCESPLRWVDLGPDYFPRYLRSADCAHNSCRSEHFVCRPRSFTVKVLRRREGMCAPAGDILGATLHEESTVGLPHDLRDLWIWELRAINFCCVCHVR